MTRTRRVTSIVGCIAAAMGAVLLSGAPAQAREPEPTAGFAIFVVKDQGGGAYWLTTTTAQQTLQTATDDGRDALLTVNEEVLLPAEELLTGSP